MVAVQGGGGRLEGDGGFGRWRRVSKAARVRVCGESHPESGSCVLNVGLMHKFA